MLDKVHEVCCAISDKEYGLGSAIVNTTCRIAGVLVCLSTLIVYISESINTDLTAGNLFGCLVIESGALIAGVIIILCTTPDNNERKHINRIFFNVFYYANAVVGIIVVSVAVYSAVMLTKNNLLGHLGFSITCTALFFAFLLQICFVDQVLDKYSKLG